MIAQIVICEVYEMDEYKKLLVLISAIDNLEGLALPFNIIKENIQPLKEYIEHRIKEIEDLKE